MEMYDQQQVHGEMVDDGGVGGELLLPEGDFALLSHVAVDSTGRFSVSAVSFDPFEELLWAGHTGGRVVSYYGPALEKYTAFQTVPLNSEHMDIRALQAIEPGVLALSSKQLACNRRQGLSHFVHSSMHFIDMHCMHRMPNAPGTLVLGGNQQKMIQLDLETRKEQRLLQITQPNCMLLRSNSKFIFSADTSGSVTLRSLQTLEGVHALQAHQGPISDFDVCGTKLITCGYSPRMGQLSTDRFLRIYDIRTLRPLPPITISIAPSFIRFLPSYSDSRIVIASDVGEFQVFEIGANGIFPCQIDTQGSALFCLDSSPTKQCLAFGDAAGYVHLFSDRAEPVLNEEAWPTEFADAPMPVPTISFDDSLAPLAIIPLPFSADGEYLSDLPPELCKRVYRQAEPISADVIQSMRMVQFVGYAKNPHPLTRRNIVPYANAGKHSQHLTGHSTTTTTTTGSGIGGLSPMKTASAPNIADHVVTVPKFYRKVHVRPGKFSSEDFDYRRYNKTDLVAIEALVPNAYCTAVLLALFHIRALKSAVLHHLCRKEYCLSCELCFLFRMLHDRTVEQPASASNFIRAFRMIPEAAALGLVLNDKDDSSTQLANLEVKVQSFNRFLLQQLSLELTLRPGRLSMHGRTTESIDEREEEEGPDDVISADQPAPAKEEATGASADEYSDPIHELLATEAMTLIRCVRCDNETTSKSSPLIVSLVCPPNSEPMRFCSLLERSFNLKQQLSAFCTQCDKYTTTTQTRRVQRLPNVLAVDVHITTDKDRAFWTTQQTQFEKRRVYSTPGATAASVERFRRPCRYGDDCRKPFCRYAHSDQNESASYLPLSDSEDASFSDDPTAKSATDSPISHYLVPRLSIRLADGLTIITPQPSTDERAVDYTLKAMVIAINDGDQPTNLVTAVRRGASAGDSRDWVVFNEFVVTRVSEDEALHLDLSWKTPCLLYYVRDDMPDDANAEARLPVDESVLWADECLSVRRRLSSSTFVILEQEEVPKAGEIIAIDAEFVTLNPEETEFRSDGSKSTVKPSQMSVARVSCIRGSGPKECVPFMDDYITTPDEVHDYLTKFSGIKPGDLDPSASTKHLTTLKAMYLKLLYMVDQGVVFVGHGLSNDFRMINIYVPPEQTIDTVHVFHLPHQRMVSLRFLAWHFLGENIQAETHDSVEDARTALRIYKKYLELTAEGSEVFEKALNDLYETGRRLQWKVPDSQ